MECPFKIEVYADIAYVEQLRMITPEDFKLVNPTAKSNALDFLTDDPWDFRTPIDINFTPPSFAATSSVEFIWLQELENQYIDCLPKIKDNKDQVKSFIETLSRAHKESYTFITHSFNWTGCKSEESRLRKLKKHKQMFEEKFEDYKEEKERKLINSAMKRCVTYLDNVNSSFTNRLLYRIDYSTENVKIPSIEEEQASLNTELLILQEKMNPIKQRLREIENEKFKARVDQIMDHLHKDGFPYPVITTLNKELSKKKEQGIPAGRFLPSGF
jgi:hypothetical protein